MKEGYQLVKKGGEENKRDFVLKKLSALIVEIEDKDTHQPISNVINLLSSAAPNSAVEQKPGRYVFTNIKQGKQRLQVMLREYEFENNGIKEIDIKEGETHTVHIAATRVSFSAYGRVTELSMRGVKNALVIATCSNQVCKGEVHEAVTNGDGDFRIEELKPDGEYQVTIAKGKLGESEQDYGQKLESKIHATIPKQLSFTMLRADHRDVREV